MEQRVPPRRHEFDAIANGWGFDTRACDLQARIDLIGEFTASHGALTFAESRVLTAMQKALVPLRSFDEKPSGQAQAS